MTDDNGVDADVVAYVLPTMIRSALIVSHRDVIRLHNEHIVDHLSAHLVSFYNYVDTNVVSK